MSQPKSFLPFDLDVLFENPVFAGGAGLAGLGAVAAIARRSAIRGAGLIKRRLLVNLEVSKQDPAYNFILAWLALPRPPAGRIVANLSRIHNLSIKTSLTTSPNGVLISNFKAQPGFGRVLVQHKNVSSWITRNHCFIQHETSKAYNPSCGIY